MIKINKLAFFLINMFTVVMLMMWMMIVWGHKDVENNDLKSEISTLDSTIHEQDYIILNYSGFMIKNPELQEGFNNYKCCPKPIFTKKYPNAKSDTIDLKSRISIIIGFGSAFAALVIVFFITLYASLGKQKLKSIRDQQNEE